MRIRTLGDTLGFVQWSGKSNHLSIFAGLETTLLEDLYFTWEEYGELDVLYQLYFVQPPWIDCKEPPPPTPLRD